MYSTKNLLFVLLFSLPFITSCDEERSQNSSAKPESDRTISSINEEILADPNNSDLYIDRSRRHVAIGDLNSAFNDVNRAIEIDSTNADHYFELGSLYYQIGKVGEAKYALERAMDLDPEHTDAKLEMAEVFFVLTNHDRAMSMINEALRVDDQIAKAYFLKGLIYKEQGNSSLSKSSFQTVTELDPENVEAFNLLGMIYAGERDSLALEYYNTALSIDSTSREVLYNRAFFLQEDLRAEAALQAYDDLLRHHPGTAVAHFNQGYVYMGLMSDPESGINSYTEAIRLNPSYFQAYTNRAVCLEEIGRREQAVADYNKALEIEPNFEPALKGLNRLH